MGPDPAPQFKGILLVRIFVEHGDMNETSDEFATTVQNCALIVMVHSGFHAYPGLFAGCYDIRSLTSLYL